MCTRRESPKNSFLRFRVHLLGPASGPGHLTGLWTSAGGCFGWVSTRGQWAAGSRVVGSEHGILMKTPAQEASAWLGIPDLGEPQCHVLCTSRCGLQEQGRTLPCASCEKPPSVSL